MGVLTGGTRTADCKRVEASVHGSAHAGVQRRHGVSEIQPLRRWLRHGDGKLKLGCLHPLGAVLPLATGGDLCVLVIRPLVGSSFAIWDFSAWVAPSAAASVPERRTSFELVSTFVRQSVALRVVSLLLPRLKPRLRVKDTRVGKTYWVAVQNH